MRVFLSCLLGLLMSSSAAAQLSDNEINAKTREVNRALRCVVCQNQSIDESDSPLAADMRKLVRRQISEGKSEDEVIAYMRQTYGDYVLLKPPVQSNTIVLWFAPLLLLLGVLAWFIRAGKTAGDTQEKEPS